MEVGKTLIWDNDLEMWPLYMDMENMVQWVVTVDRLRDDKILLVPDMNLRH